MGDKLKPEVNKEKSSKASRGSALSTWMPITIALFSLVLAVHEGYESRKFKRLSVRPEILISFYHNNKGAGWHLFNGGLGPARINWFKVTVDGHPKKNWSEVANALVPGLKDFEYTIPGKTSVIQTSNAGQHTELFWVAELSYAAILTQNVNRTNLSICYCSTYDECWQRDTNPSRVESSCNEESSMVNSEAPR
jgi:hypothetical protein